MLRVITGRAKGIRLDAPTKGTRPLTDRIKTSIFDLIRDFIPGGNILDLYAGSGAFGIETLSRGAASCTFIDLSNEAIDIIENNLEKTNLFENASVIQKNVNDFIVDTKEIFDIVFLDPPFDDKTEPDFSGLQKIVKEDGIIIYRTVQNKRVELEKTELTIILQKIYGKSKVLFLRKRENNQEEN